MRFGSNQLFVVVLLALLAGLSFWLQRAVTPVEIVRDGKLRHDPDAMAENFLVRQFDEKGRVKYRLTAPYMMHFPERRFVRTEVADLDSLSPGRCITDAVGQECPGHEQGPDRFPVG